MSETNDTSTLMWAITGLAVAASAVAAFLWSAIIRTHSRITTETNSIWNSMNTQKDKAHDAAIDHERRFATKGDVTELRTHMDQSHADINGRLDEITNLILNRNGHA